MRFTLYAALAGAACAADLGEACDGTASVSECTTTGQECSGANATGEVCKWSTAQADGIACVVKYYADECTSAYCAPTTTGGAAGTCTAKPVLGAACAVEGTPADLGFTEGTTGMGSCAASNGNSCDSTALVCKWTTAQALTAICAAATDCTSAFCSIASGSTLGTCMVALGGTCTETTVGTTTTNDCGVTPAQGDQCLAATGTTTPLLCSWSAAQADGAACMVAASPTTTGQSTDCSSSYCVVATGDTIGVCTAKPTLGETCVILAGVTNVMGNCATGQGDTCDTTSSLCTWGTAQAAGAACLTSDEKEHADCTDGWCEQTTGIPDGEVFGLVGTCAKKPGLLKIEDADGKGYYETKTIWHLGSAMLKCMMKFQIGCAMNTLFKNIGSLFKFF